MHVAQIAAAVTRDLITKYHYFHTSFQIWPDQIKVRARGSENCTLSRVIHSGWLERGGKPALSRCPQGRCRETAARDVDRKGDSLGSALLQSGGCGLWVGPQGMKENPSQGRCQVAESGGSAAPRCYRVSFICGFHSPYKHLCST